MDAKERAAFVDAYTKVLTSSWSSEEHSRQLEEDPRSVLAADGLHIPVGAQIDVVRLASGEPDLDRQIELWEEGRETGHYTIHVPATPRIYTRELSDGDLGSISGGIGGACCSCCPCSCST